MEEEEGKMETGGIPIIFRDIRRYSCEYCGIVRSKKTLITSHIQSHHQDKVKENEDAEEKGSKVNVCEECGASFSKPAHLKQHMLSHSFEENSKMRDLDWISIRSGDLLRSSIKLTSITRWKYERPFSCPIDDCNLSYRRKDHLNRHLLQHKGTLFDCPIETCKSRFSSEGKLTRHVREIHDDTSSTSDELKDDDKQYACTEPGCGKVFKYASKLRTHEESHVRLETVEAFCAEPGCMKYFTNDQCLKAHLHSCHQHINCEICGSKQLKKNIKRHLRTHEKVVPKEKVKCSFDGCNLTFSTNSNLRQHVKAAHLQQKPFECSFSGCGMRFSFKHVRDNHEKSGRHVYTQGDFLKGDEQFLSRPRGGLKRKMPDIIETIMRKRAFPPTESGGMHGSDYISFLLSADDED